MNNPITLVLGTSNGFQVVHRHGEKWESDAHGVDYEISALATVGNVICAGTYGHGLFVSQDRGQKWRKWNMGLSFPHIRALVYDPHDPTFPYAGTEPAALFIAQQGEMWHEVNALRELPGAEKWSLPYSPRGGALRSFTFLPDQTLVGAIEVGGVIWSNDIAKTEISRAGAIRSHSYKAWQINSSGLHPDVHSVAHDGEWVLAATGGGIFRTREIEREWERVENDYTRALLVLPNPILAGAAKGVGQRGRIIASRDHGATWSTASRGLNLPIKTMFEHFLAVGDEIFAVTEDGEVYHSPQKEIHWVRTLEKFPNVHPIAML